MLTRRSVLALLLLTTNANLGAQRSRACWLVTPSEVAEILGKPELASGTSIDDDRLECNYLAAGIDVHLDDLLTPAQRSAALKESIKQGKAEAIAGIGDEAAFSPASKNRGTSALVVLVGSRRLTTSIFRWNGPTEQIEPTLVKLAKAALTRLVAPVTPERSRACWVITPSEAAQILEKPSLADGSAMRDAFDKCDYKSAGLDIDITYFKRAPAPGEAFGAWIKQGRAQAASGLGDDAVFFKDLQSGDPSVAVVMGKRILKLTMLQSAQASQEQVRAKLMKLATAAVARLR